MKFAAVLLFMALEAAAGNSSKEFSPDYESAVGMIFVNAEQELPEAIKVYADFEKNDYTFDFDAAWVYFFDANAEESYAGAVNFTGMTFAARSDSDTVWAEGNIAYLPRENSQNSVAAYYLYHDQTGIYFNTEAGSDEIEITDGCTMEGIDYPCEATFHVEQPVSTFSVWYCKNGETISQTDYTPDEIEDYQTIDVESGISSAEIRYYDENRQEIGKETITPENPDIVICFDNGGQILGSKSLSFRWE